MLKPIFILTLFTSLFQAAFAQQDTTVYYLNNSGRVVSTKDSADFFLVILPPDTNVDKKLFVVKEFYTNGKLKLVGGSTGNSLENLKFQGPYMAFYPNGHKMLMRNYEKGLPVAAEIEYYPNGKLYHIRRYASNDKIFLKQYNDSTGNVLAKNGYGNWKEFSGDFKKVEVEGPVNNGLQDEHWFVKLNDSVYSERIYDKGLIIYSSNVYRYKSDNETLSNYDIRPEFPGGDTTFNKFVASNLKYPKLAKDKGTQGRVFIAFVVEKNGYLDNIKVLRGIGDGCDEEATRVVQLFPLWKPAMKNGEPVRVQFSAAIDFYLKKPN